MPKAQHNTAYRPLPAYLRELREQADLTQRALGDKLSKPQSWVYSCEAGIRRVDVTEFAAWALACHLNPVEAFSTFIQRRK